MQEYLRSFKGDLFGGITAAVVGLPVALAFGEASGLGALAGIYGAIAVGFFAAVFGGTRSQISGPTGPMAVAMAVVVTLHADNLAAAFTIVIMAGLFQVLLGLVGIGRFIAFTPYSVISGFMSGIGIIIILLQTLPFIGMPVAEGGPIGSHQGLGRGHRQLQHGRLCHRRRNAGRRHPVARATPAHPPADAGRAGRRHLDGRAVAHRRSHHRLVPTGLPTPQLPDLNPRASLQGRSRPH